MFIEHTNYVLVLSDVIYVPYPGLYLRTLISAFMFTIEVGLLINLRCIPKKMTWNFAAMAEALRDSKHYGFKTPDNIPFDFASFKKKRDARILTLNGVYEVNWSREGIELVHGTARFVGPKELEVELQDGSGKANFTAPHIVCLSSV